jgi:hypothetical protein
MRQALLSTLLVVGFLSCRSGPTEEDALRWREQEMARERVETEAGTVSPAWQHQGPRIAPGGTGPARFALLLHEVFEEPRALELCRTIDGWWREPGNEGFEAVMDRLRSDLDGMGFGRLPEYELAEYSTEMREPAWTPLSGSLTLVTDAAREPLHAFAAASDVDRLLLPKGLPSCECEGSVALSLETLAAGGVLVSAEPLSRGLLEAAEQRGAVLVLSSALADYNRDPSPAQRHLDAIAYTSYPRGAKLPAGQISPRTHQRLQAGMRVRFEARTRLETKPLRTLVATIVGTQRADQAVAIAAHVQEPGACDNASGVATSIESLRALTSLIDSGRLRRPAASLSFVFGDEMAMSRVYLERGGRKVLAAIAADMTGESRERTGAIPLLERSPDPARRRQLPPDEPSGWGADSGRGNYENSPNSALALIVRIALGDTALAAGGWQTREHAFEGGSDHQVFLRAGIPAVLLWHFPDFAYHTSLDRMEHVDAAEMRRMGTALVSAGMALADPAPGDLDRYLRSLALEQDLRVSAAKAAEDEELAERWRAWLRSSRQWLRTLCLGEKAGELPAETVTPKPAGP